MRKCILLVLFLTACAANQQGEPDSPIPAFHQVDDQIYRGAQPASEQDILFLKQKHITTILDLSDDANAHANEVLWAKNNNINLVWIPLNGFWAPSDADMKSISDLINTQAAHPIYIHCLHGHDRTGLVIGEYRRQVYSWSKSTAWHEMLEMGFHPMLLGLTYYFWEER